MAMMKKDREKSRGSGGPIHEFSMNKSLGQNLLKSPQILDAIVEKAQLKSTDTVLEIGPGTGNLTVRMLERVKKVFFFLFLYLFLFFIITPNFYRLL
jgi:18S rRNA (adenine1779-N6/adenine1780-N6)-dimethyltransferase